MATKPRDVLRLFISEAAFLDGSKKRQMGYDKATGRLLMHNNTDDTLSGAWSKDSLQALLAGTAPFTAAQTFNSTITMNSTQKILLGIASNFINYVPANGDSGIKIQVASRLYLSANYFDLGKGSGNVALSYKGSANTGLFTWVDASDYFQFSDDVLINSTEKLYFNSSAASLGGWIQHDGTDLIIKQNFDDGTGELRLEIACGDFVVMENSIERLKYTSSSVTWKMTGGLEVDQAEVAFGVPVLTLTQADVSEEMMAFACTIGVGNALEAVGAKALTTTHFIKITLPGALTRYIPAGTIA